MLLGIQDLEKLLQKDRFPSGGPVVSASFINAIPIDHQVFKHDHEDLESNAYVERNGSLKGVKKLIRKLIAPEYAQSRVNVRRMVEACKANASTPVILIIGAGNQGSGIAPLYASEDTHLVGLDVYPSPFVNLVADAHDIPLMDASVDGVIIQAVLEHVFDPTTVVSEIHRVLKPGGVVYAETPFLQHVHEGAYDFCRFTESGHRYLFRRFSLIDSGIVAGAGTQLLWSVEYFVRGMTRSWTCGKLAKTLFFWLLYCDRFIPESFNRDAASCTYFLGQATDVEICHKDLIEFYSRSEPKHSE